MPTQEPNRAESTVTVLLGDPELPDLSKPGGQFTPDDHEQVERLRAALSLLDGYSFDYRREHDTLLEDLRRNPPSFALNFCDTGFRNDARKELHVAAYLELLGIPYSGSGPVTLGLCYDKALVRALAQAHGVPVPEERFLGLGDALPAIGFPAFVKPNRADGSVGITRRSIVNDAGELAETVAELRRTPAGAELVVQEFLCGAEYGLGILGNPGDGFDVLPVLEVDYDALDPALPRLLDYDSKTDPSSPYWRDVRFRRARLDEATLGDMRAWCETLFARLGLRDYARFDFRADVEGRLKLMEVNPNPAWCHDGKLAHMAAQRGDGHAALLERILEVALRRCRVARG